MQTAALPWPTLVATRGPSSKQEDCKPAPGGEICGNVYYQGGRHAKPIDAPIRRGERVTDGGRGAEATPSSDEDCRPVPGGEVCGGIFYQGGRKRQPVTVQPSKAGMPGTFDLNVVAIEWLPPRRARSDGDGFALSGGRISGGLPAGQSRPHTQAELREAMLWGAIGRSMVFVSPALRVTVQNRGRERWAYSGSLLTRLTAGGWDSPAQPPASLEAFRGFAAGGEVGRSHAYRLGSLAVRVPLEGSIGASESKAVTVLNFSGPSSDYRKDDPFAIFRIMFETEKYYSATLTLSVTDSSGQSWYRAYRAQFRIGQDGRALEMQVREDTR
ncbi:MAG: hypothetical protein N2688_11220 [Burkholderiaceae bacterium]|nr:hypothetical protein [Burkholderiaceae bacterium]